jgi:hypothetical protein
MFGSSLPPVQCRMALVLLTLSVLLVIIHLIFYPFLGMSYSLSLFFFSWIFLHIIMVSFIHKVMLPIWWMLENTEGTIIKLLNPTNMILYKNQTIYLEHSNIEYFWLTLSMKKYILRQDSLLDVQFISFHFICTSKYGVKVHVDCQRLRITCYCREGSYNCSLKRDNFVNILYIYYAWNVIV